MAAAGLGYRFLWVPSHIGALAVILQAQKKTCFASSAVNACGVKSVSLCEPSQKGCLALRPQVHQW